jgi:hypothetical protein
MSDNKLHKYESDSSMPSLKMMLVEKKSKGINIPAEPRLRSEFRPVLDKRNAVSRLIIFLKDQY